MDIIQEVLNEVKLTNQRMDERFDAMDERIDSMDERIDKLEEHVKLNTNSLVNMENVWTTQIKAALDGCTAALEKLNNHDKRITKVESVTENHDLRLFVLEEKAGTKAV